MNILKAVKKYIPFTLKALVAIPFIFLVIPVLTLELMEYFQPKKILIGDIHVEAPPGMRLTTAWVDYETIQKPYYPLLLQNRYIYSFPKNGSAAFWFLAINNDAVASILDIYIDKDNNKTKNEAKKDFINYVNYDIKHEYKTNSYKDMESKECFGYAKHTDGINSISIFHYETGTRVTISSDNHIVVRNILHQFCPGFSRKEY